MYITHVPYFRIQPDFSYSFETWRCLDRARGVETNAQKCDDMKGYLPMQSDLFHCCSQGLHWMLSTGCQSPYINDFSTKMETNYYRTSHTWTIRVSSSRPAPLRRHNPVSFRFPSSFPSLEGRSPPLRMWPNRAQTYLDSAISSLWDRNSACLSSLVSLHSICDARDERGALLTHFRALFLPKPS